MSKENWDDLRVVLAASRTGNFGEAARLLSVNESTVVRRIAQVEERLAARLFDRVKGKLTLTDAGLEIASLAERIEIEVQSSTRTISGADVRVAGTVRVTSVPILTNRILIPALPNLLGQHPDLNVELVAEARSLSLTKREADIAIRLARPRDEVSVVARKLGDLPYGVYLREGAAEDTLRWLTYDDRMNDLPQAEWMAKTIGLGQGSAGQVMVNDAEALLACVQEGLGKTLLPVAVGESIGGLVRATQFPCDLTREIWLLVHPDLRKLNRVRTVIDWAAATVNALASRHAAGC
ncbi:DNA-binding transcriptional LysR family regulator [Paraburkholderia sp. RAU6.4a]|uniref:Transcriptional regulator, LysR family n=1 Tax=Paraburkholderia tuberum TaxID=157910 RepID=A0A1H1JHG5_9BURK|nr:LysR family transcriptional regulator [Paraburkholderia tuberum]SDR49481.1 transcriptional regulator, LysR family [Paraburkholderia tuberum]